MMMKFNKIVYFSLLIIILLGNTLFAQNAKKDIYEGNQLFAEKNYAKAEKQYRTATADIKEKKNASAYNLGNSIYRQNQPSEAKFQFAEAAKELKSKKEKHKAYHNLGNTLMLDENYDGAVQAYKEALRNNPYDEETRYNYALARKKQKQNNNNKNKDDKNKGGGGDNKQKDQNKDKNKNQDQNKEQNQNEENKDNKQEQNKENKDKEEQKNNQQPTGADKQKIDNILDAVNNAEQKLQEKINAKKVKTKTGQNKKDW